jgi:lantibiotic modifying enzyme
MVYGMTTIASLLDDESPMEAAASVATLITRERIGSDDRFDVTAGAAGAILGLLSLHGAGANAGHALEAAVDAGEHLIASAEHTPAGHVFWRTYDGRALTGLSHGASGIALAMKRLGTATGDRRYSDTAAAALAFEDSLFDPARGNWPDLRTGTEQWVCRVCHGAAGIALARVELDPDSDPTTAALETTRSAGRAEIDSLCCGTAGRIDALLHAGQLLGRPELVAAGRSLAQGLLEDTTGVDLILQGPAPSLGFTPGLFLGLAGVGYAFLRASHLDVPCATAWVS